MRPIDPENSIIDVLDRTRDKADGAYHRLCNVPNGLVPSKMRNGWIKMKTNMGLIAIRSNINNKVEQDVVVQIRQWYIVAAYMS